LRGAGKGQGLVTGQAALNLSRVVSVNLFESAKDGVVIARPVFRSVRDLDWHDTFFVRPEAGRAFHQLCGISGMKALGNIHSRGEIKTGHFTARAPETGTIWLCFERAGLVLNQTEPPYEASRKFHQRILTDPADIAALGIFLLVPRLPRTSSS